MNGEIRVLSPKEYSEMLKKRIGDDGIIFCIKEQLDEWVSICHPLGYLGFSESIERAQNIMDFLNTYIELKGKYPNTDFEHQTLNLEYADIKEPAEER